MLSTLGVYVNIFPKSTLHVQWQMWGDDPPMTGESGFLVERFVGHQETTYNDTNIPNRGRIKAANYSANNACCFCHGKKKHQNFELKTYLKRSYQFVWVHKPQNASRYADVWFVLNFRSKILTTVLHIAFSNAFQGKKSVILLFKFHRIMFHGVQLTCLYWFRLWPGAEQATGNRMNQRWSNSLAHICISRPQWAGRVSLCWWHDRCTTAASRASS